MPTPQQSHSNTPAQRASSSATGCAFSPSFFPSVRNTARRIASGIRSNSVRAARSPVDIAVPPWALSSPITCAALRFASAVARASRETMYPLPSKATTKNRARSSRSSTARTTARVTDCIRAPDIDPDLSRMNPTTSSPVAFRSASAVTETIASTRVVPGARWRF